MVVNISLFSVACGVSLYLGQFSKDTGLNWEFYLMIWVVNALWMNIQAVIHAGSVPPSLEFSMATYPLAALSGTAPYMSEWFDTLTDTVFAFMCLDSSHLFVKFMGLGALGWLVILHVVLALVFKDIANEMAAAYFSVFSTEPISSNSEDLPLKTKLWLKLYAQCTTNKRLWIAAEEVPQAYFRVMYAYFEQPSWIFTAVMVLIPWTKFLVSVCFPTCLAKRVVPFWRLSLKQAIACGDQEKLADVNNILCLYGSVDLLSKVLEPKVADEETAELLQNLRDNGGPGKPLRELADTLILFGQGVQSLELESVDLWTTHLCFIAQRCLETKLQSLSVYNIVLMPTALDVLANSAMLCLQELRLTRCTVRDKGAMSLATGIQRSSTLQHFEQTGNQIGGEAALALADCLKESETLCSVKLAIDQWHFGRTNGDKTEIGQAFVEALTARASTLKSFSLLRQARHPFDTGLMFQVPWNKLLQTPASLISVALQGYIVNTNQVDAIAKGLADNTTLTHLDLSYNSFGDLGVDLLMTALSKNATTNLKKLYLKNISCTDRALLPMHACTRPPLRFLDLRKNSFSVSAPIVFNEELYSCGKNQSEGPISKSLTTRKVLVVRDLSTEQYEEAHFTELHRACYEGDFRNVEQLLKSQPIENLDLERVAEGHGTCLEIAARHDELRIVKMLVRARAYPGSALRDAIRAHHWEVADCLRAAGAAPAEPTSGEQTAAGVQASAAVNKQDERGRTPLFKAVLQFSEEEVRALLFARADVNIASFENCDQPQETPLTVACRRMDGVEIVRKLLQGGSPVDSMTNKNCTALHVAASCSSVETVQVLLDANADIEALDKTGCSPLYYAESAEIVKCLLDKKATISSSCFLDALQMPHFLGKDLSKLKILLEAKADPNAEQDGWLPLHFSMVASSKLVGLAPLQQGALAQEEQRALADCVTSPWPYIEQSAADHRAGLLKLLIGAGAQVNLASEASGETALCLACRAGDTTAAQVLLEASADPTIADKTGETPLTLAMNSEEMKEVFEKYNQAA